VTLNLLDWIQLLRGALLCILALSAYPIILRLPPSGPFDLELPEINFEHLLSRGRLYRFLSEDLIKVFQKVIGAC
jgi:hypothetical protein